MMKNKIERMSSIEKEPQALSFDQINYAREAALYVISTNPIEEAIRIFTEGLEPVLCVKNGDNSMKKMMMIMDSDDQNYELRDIATAPF